MNILTGTPISEYRKSRAAETSMKDSPPRTDVKDKTLYGKLCVKTREIRLVQLLPGKDTDEILCELLTVSLDSSPSFEALSYVWGDEKVTVPISVNERPLRVTTNLRCALQGHRSSTVMKTMWIDAISIDQNNTEERNQQLQLMREIYSRAAHVSVWFGSQSDESNAAMNLLLQFTLPQHFAEFAFAAHSTEHRFLDDTELSIAIHPLELITQNPWWERIWVVQEVALARRAIIYYGQRSCEWNNLACVTHWVDKHAFCCGSHLANYPKVFDIMDRFHMRTYRQVELCQRFQNLEHLALSWSLNHLRFLQASDPRDKVYGVLGLTQGLQLDVNYSLSVEATYESTTRRIIWESKSLEVLSQATLPPQRGRLPSWVPNWSYHDDISTGAKMGANIRQLQHLYSACNGRKVSLTCDSANGIILLQGVHFDSVSHTTPPIISLLKTTKLPSVMDHQNFHLDVLKHYREIAQGDTALVSTAKDGQDLPDEMWRRLLLDIMVDNSPNSFRRTTPNDYEKCSNLTKIGEEKDDMTPHTFAYLMSIVSNHSDRCIFSTGNHRIGVGPKETQDGDLVCILDGGPLPFILRENTNATSRTDATPYILVGTAYVHGVMDGEIMRELEQGKGAMQEFPLV